MLRSVKKIPRVAFLFTNPREEIITRVQAGEDADTALRGLNHISGSEYFVVIPKKIRSLLFIPRLLRYDFVIAQDNLLLGYIVSMCARVFFLKTRWLYTAINSSTLIRRHTFHPVRLFLLKKIWASYFRIICISFEQHNDFIRIGIPSERLVFVPFGVDTNFFQPTDISREENLIVSVGRDAGRDYATLFKAIEQTNYKCIVVAGHKNIPPGMVIPSNVSVLYNRSYVEIRDLYARAQLVVIVSKDEQVPDGSDCSGQTVILDALAAGKAVIATHRSWINDYFVPDQDLVVVDPNNPKALVHAINSLSRDGERRKRIAASGHAKVADLYATKTFAKALSLLMDFPVK